MKGTRREFFGQSAKLVASGLIGSSVIQSAAQASEQQPATQPGTSTGPASTQPGIETRVLGRTGLKVTTISLGSIGTSEAVVRYSLDQGINFMHTCIQYGRGNAIREIGKAIKGSKHKFYLGLKVTWDWKEDARFDECLKLLGRDYVDIIFFNIHNDPERVASPEAKEAFERWKKQGKARFMGLTSHGGMKPCMESALKTDWYDCLMPSYDLSMRDDYLDIFKQCEEKNVGFVAMKTKISESNVEPIPALLNDPQMTTICKSLTTLSAVRKYLDAANEKPAVAQINRAMKMAALGALGRCKMCGACTGECVNGLAVNDIVRSVDYYVDTMKDYDAGAMAYHDINPLHNADQCQDCGACEKICPSRVPIRHFVRRSTEIFA